MVQLPERKCDLIMKGGITSGVVYPLAVCELAKAFRFKNIGGASAGAIAAAAAAAAEFGRHQQKEDSFDRLRQLPQFLSSAPPGEKKTHLFSFFQPQRQTRRLFNTCVAGLGGGLGAPLRVVAAASVNFWLAGVIGALPGLLFAWLAWRASSLPLIAGGILFALVGFLLAVAAAFVIKAVTAIPANGFGLASGMSGAANTKAPALTPWLTAYLNELAGLEPNGDPLTFGQLWNASPGEASPAINLEMMTTCLTHGRPYRLPLRDDDDTRDLKQFYFRRSDFAPLFPEHVVGWMEAHFRKPGEDDSGKQDERFREAGFIPLPEPEDFPVVVAVRMSLSFPILLSAVPLYAVDRGRKDQLHRLPERCWFSDGGIGSNFPIHLFDATFPRWPTFGIDLTEKHPDFDAGFYMPRNNFGGALVKWSQFDHGSPLQRLVGFIGQIVMTAKDWADNAQCRLPGFRDRIGQISLTNEDGGLNLDMPPERIARLCSYGEIAGREFVKRFATDDPDVVLNWRNHRRVRLRSGLAMIEEWLLRVERSCVDNAPGDVPYEQMIQEADPPSYRWTNKTQQATGAALLAQLLAAARGLSGDVLREGSPRPRPALRTRPRI